jgi:hypothetical protein
MVERLEANRRRRTAWTCISGPRIGRVVIEITLGHSSAVPIEQVGEWSSPFRTYRSVYARGVTRCARLVRGASAAPREASPASRIDAVQLTTLQQSWAESITSATEADPARTSRSTRSSVTQRERASGRPGTSSPRERTGRM